MNEYDSQHRFDALKAGAEQILVYRAVRLAGDATLENPQRWEVCYWTTDGDLLALYTVYTDPLERRAQRRAEREIATRKISAGGSAPPPK